MWCVNGLKPRGQFTKTRFIFKSKDLNRLDSGDLASTENLQEKGEKSKSGVARGREYSGKGL